MKILIVWLGLDHILTMSKGLQRYGTAVAKPRGTIGKKPAGRAMLAARLAGISSPQEP